MHHFKLGSETCSNRGYHGPFTRAEIFDSFPGWEGMANCAVCGTTCHVATELERQQGSGSDSLELTARSA